MMDGLGIHVLAGETLLELLRRVGAGEDPDEVYMETYVNAEHVSVEEEGEDE